MRSAAGFLGIILLSLVLPTSALCGVRDLKEIRQEGVLRHLGVPYANFVNLGCQGLDCEVIRLFARQIGVSYKYVQADWSTVINDLIGKRVVPDGNQAKILGEAPFRGDIIANGLTILPWREEILDYSIPTFPTQVWLVARSDSPLKPVVPSGNEKRDIYATIKLLAGKTLLGKKATCLDPELYDFGNVSFTVKYFAGKLDEMAPAIINGRADVALLDVPDALVALAKWPGEIIILGPVSPRQKMGAGFRKTSPELRDAFNQFFKEIVQDGTYLRLVKRYYPDVIYYYPQFFQKP